MRGSTRRPLLHHPLTPAPRLLRATSPSIAPVKALRGEEHKIMSTSVTDHSALAGKGKARVGGGAARALGPPALAGGSERGGGLPLGSDCGTRSGDRRSVALYRHRVGIGLLNHRHDDEGDPLPEAPHGKHSQGRDAPTPAQVPQECQLRLNLRVGHCLAPCRKNATRPPRLLHAFGQSGQSVSRPVAPWRHVAHQRSPAEEKSPL